MNDLTPEVLRIPAAVAATMVPHGTELFEELCSIGNYELVLASRSYRPSGIKSSWPGHAYAVVRSRLWRALMILRGYNHRGKWKGFCAMPDRLDVGALDPAFARLENLEEINSVLDQMDESDREILWRYAHREVTTMERNERWLAIWRARRIARRSHGD